MAYHSLTPVPYAAENDESSRPPMHTLITAIFELDLPPKAELIDRPTFGLLVAGGATTRSMVTLPDPHGRSGWHQRHIV